jgi:hypothetical protein
MSEKKDLRKSIYAKEQHARARAKKQLYEDITGKSDIEYSEFLKNNSPIEEYIEVYNVSFQLSYRGESGSLQINPQTFQVYALKGFETENEIYQNTMDMVLDMKGEKTNNELPPNTREKLENSVKIEIKPRGMEKTNLTQIKDTSVYEGLVLGGGKYVKNLDNVTTLKNGKGGKSKVKLDITHFI